MASHCLRKPRIEGWGGKISLLEIGVLGPQVGCYRTVPGVSTVSAIHWLTDNNPLTYILTTPNLDALGHRWVAALAGYNMSIRYLKGSDNKVADALSLIETRLDPDTVTELLNHAKGTGPQAEIEDIRVIEEEERADQEVILRTIQLARQDKKFRNLRTEDWHRAQLMDPVIPHVLDWLRLPRNNRVKLKDFL